MNCCKKGDTTVDYDSDKSGIHLSQINSALKNFQDNITNTQKAFQQLLATFDHSGQTYANMAATSNDPNKAPIVEFRDGMREMQEKGPFVTFNSELHAGTIDVFNDVKAQLDEMKKAEKTLNNKKKSYDSARNNVEKIEKSYAKKDKPLANDSAYTKAVAKRDTAKQEYEDCRDNFAQETDIFQKRTNKALHKSLNNYIASTATLCGYLETTLNGYRSDLSDPTQARSTELSKLKDKAAKESKMRRDRLNPDAAYPEQAAPTLTATDSEAPHAYPQEGNGTAHNPLDPAHNPAAQDISKTYPQEEEGGENQAKDE